jgi:hygromycin-B 4-O-kinase
LRQLPHCERIFVEGEACLRSLLPLCPEIRHIVHRDLLNRNALVSFDATKLEAVFDWGCSLAGDFVYEIAWLTFWSPWHPAIQSLSLRQTVPKYYAEFGLEVDNFEKRLSAYELQIGLEHIAYCAFSDRPNDLEEVTRATEQVLKRLSAQQE